MYLIFVLVEEEYGVGIGVVIEIVGMQWIMFVLDMLYYVKGVINLCGKVILFMDVCLCFGMFEKEYDDCIVVIVMDVDDLLIGLIVDGVSEVFEILGG